MSRFVRTFDRSSVVLAEHDVRGEPPNRRRDLAACMGEGAAFGAMVGVGETYLAAFVLAVGLSEVTAGLVASLPLLGGGLMQLVSPAAVRMLGSHKKWVLICATVQACSFIPLVIAAMAGKISAPAVLCIATLYWGAGLATGPAWNTWVGSIVPRTLRARFFARRTRFTQIAVLAGLLGGGAALHTVDSGEAKLSVFAALFAAAATFRTLSVGLLALQSEPDTTMVNQRRMPARVLWKRLRGTHGGMLLRYLVVAQGAIQIAGPFYAPYMLKTLNFSYAQYVTLIATAFLAKILALPHLGHLAHRVGAMRMLTWSGCAIAPLAACWAVSNQFAWLLMVQIVSGISWAAYELAFFLLFFESFKEDERTDILTLYNVANSGAVVGGAALGSLVLLNFGTSQSVYLMLFAGSSIGRALALPLLRDVGRLQVEVESIGMRTTGVRPMAGSIDSPVLPSLPDQLDE